MQAKTLPYKDRAELAYNPTAKKLFTLMEEKKSNLCAAADLTNSEALFSFIEKIGREICLLKTHIDILEDFSLDVIEELLRLAKKHNFLLFEDRKFADIGNTTSLQYAKGMYRIAEWADITNAHIVPGHGIIEGMQEVGLPKERGLLLLAEMSSQGTMAHGAYTEKAIELAERYKAFVMGFISLKKIHSDPAFLHMTPGVKLQEGKDLLGQQYLTPEKVIQEGSDVIIVGRGIYTEKDPEKAAAAYRKTGWEAYVQRIS